MRILAAILLFSLIVLTSCSDLMSDMKDRKLPPARFDQNKFNDSKFHD